MIKTWSDLETAALFDPLLHAAITLVRQGTMTKEQALLMAVLALSDVNALQREKLVELYAHGAKIK